jgi:diphthamide synthase (EF-2-diphthine--ammonia ligase)
VSPIAVTPAAFAPLVGVKSEKAVRSMIDNGMSVAVVRIPGIRGIRINVEKAKQYIDQLTELQSGN